MTPVVRIRSPALDLGRRFDITNGRQDISVFQAACGNNYASVAQAFRPDPTAFLPVDPLISVGTWNDSCPDDLHCDSHKDSAIDIVSKIQSRVNGGVKLIDAHRSTITDLMVRSRFDQLATPNTDGAQFVVDVDSPARSDSVIADLENDTMVRSTLPSTEPEGRKIVKLTLPRLSVGKHRVLGERSARTFDLEDNIPQMSSSSGRRLDAFTSIAMRADDPTSAHPILARELAIVSGVEMPLEYLTMVKKFSGDRYVRSAAQGDRKYHAVNAHASSAGAIRVRVAPMHSQSFGPTSPAHWQLFRSLARATLQLNLGMDPGLLEIAERAPSSVKFGYDIASNTLPEFSISTASISVMALMQNNPELEGFSTSPLEDLCTRRVLDSNLAREGGVRDRLIHASMKTELEVAKSTEYDDLDGVPTTAQLRIKLNDATVTAKSAIIRPSLELRRKGAKPSDDMSLSLQNSRSRVAGIPRSDFNSMGGQAVSSFGALLRYGVSIAYMEGREDIKLKCAMYVKQWNHIKDRDKLSLHASRYALRANPVLMRMSEEVITPRVSKLMFDMLPYSAIGTEARFRAIVRDKLGVSINELRQPEDFAKTFRRYLSSHAGHPERFVLRRTCGRIMHAGMSDSGLMFRISKGVSSNMSMTDIILEHVRYKIDVWKASYGAQLSLRKDGMDDAIRADYPQLVTWQQKVNMLRNVETRATNSGIEVFVRDSKFNYTMLRAYQGRHATIDKRMKEAEELAKQKKAYEKKWRVDTHPWGLVLDEAQIDDLAASPRDVVVSKLSSYDAKYWVVPPPILAQTLSDMLSEIVTGIRTAIELANNLEVLEEDAKIDDDTLVIPEDLNREVNAKYVFSLNDPPTKVDPIEKPPDGGTVPVRVTTTTGPKLMGMMFGRPRINAGGGGVKMKAPAGLARAMPKTSGLMKAPPDARSLTTVGSLTAQTPPESVVPLYTWLSEISGIAITPDSKSNLLPTRYLGNISDVHATFTLIMSDFTRHINATKEVTREKMNDDM